MRVRVRVCVCACACVTVVIATTAVTVLTSKRCIVTLRACVCVCFVCVATVVAVAMTAVAAVMPASSLPPSWYATVLTKQGGVVCCVRHLCRLAGSAVGRPRPAAVRHAVGPARREDLVCHIRDGGLGHVAGRAVVLERLGGRHAQPCQHPHRNWGQRR